MVQFFLLFAIVRGKLLAVYCLATQGKLSLSIVSVYARGLGENRKGKALFLFAKRHKTDFCFFQETHSTANKVNFWRSQWGNEIWLSHGSERSADVGTLKNKFAGNILHSGVDAKGHYICQVMDFN